MNKLRQKEGLFQIFLVEDNDDDAFLTELAIKESFTKCSLQIADNGKLALHILNKLIKENKKLPDLILLDINLPILNGLEVLKEIKSKEETKLIPVVVFTSSDSKSDISYCHNYGVDLFIRKPNNINEFRKAIYFIKEHCFQ